MHLPPAEQHNDFAEAPYAAAKSFHFSDDFFAQRPTVALIANTAWNLWNFRRDLILELTRQGFSVLCIAPPDGYEDRLQAIRHVRFIPLRHLQRRTLSPLNNLRTLWELFVLLRRERPAGVMLYTIKPNIFGAWAAHFSGIPTLAAVEGMGYLAAAPPLLRRLAFVLYRYALKTVRQVVFLNNEDARLFRRVAGLDARRTVVLPGIGIDVRQFPCQPYPLNPAPVFLFLGRLLRDKGIREFVDAARQVRRQAPGVRFLIVGSPDPGNPETISWEEVKAWMDEGIVEYLGRQDDVRPFIAQADAVVLPSYGEGLSRALLEGMAMGRPVITTDSPGCRELAEDGLDALLIPRADAALLADALLRFAALPIGVRRTMGLRARQKVQLRFSNEVVLPQYLRLIKGR